MGELITAQEIAAASKGQVHDGDPRIPVLLDAALGAIRDLCGWHVAPSLTETQILDGPGGRVMPLRSGHVTNVHSVRLSGRLLSPDEYGWSQAGMLELYTGEFPRRFRSVAVELTHGHDKVPALLGLVQQKVLAALSSPMGATSEQAGQLAVKWGRTGLALDESQRSMLAPYRLRGWT